MGDAYGSWPWDAMQEGSKTSLGSYYSCIETDPEEDPNAQGDFRGQFCQVFYLAIQRFGQTEDERAWEMAAALDSEFVSSSSSSSSRGLLPALLPPSSDAVLSSPLAQVG